MGRHDCRDLQSSCAPGYCSSDAQHCECRQRNPPAVGLMEMSNSRLQRPYEALLCQRHPSMQPTALKLLMTLRSVPGGRRPPGLPVRGVQHQLRRWWLQPKLRLCPELQPCRSHGDHRLLCAASRSFPAPRFPARRPSVRPVQVQTAAAALCCLTQMMPCARQVFCKSSCWSCRAKRAYAAH